MALVIPVHAVSEKSQANQEINKLRNKIVDLSNYSNSTMVENEIRKNHKLAKYQASLFIKVVSYEIYISLLKQGTKRSFQEIENIVWTAYQSSWIFTDFGEDHMDRFKVILQWAKDESNFKEDTKVSWKAGTYFKSIDKTVPKDTTDYGAWQINEDHYESLKYINHLYDSGVINFKIKKLHKIEDLMDLGTNCVARCVIETDRKVRGWEWKHIRSKGFGKLFNKLTKKLEEEGYYNRAFVEKYYHIVPVKTYSRKKIKIAQK